MKMKDLFQIWGRLAGRTYTAVNTNNHNNYNNNKDSSDECTENIGEKQEQRLPKIRSPKSIVSIGILGLISISIASFVLIIEPYDLLFKWKISFGVGGEIFELWKKPPVDLYLRIFLFNVTNKDAFLAGEEKLQVEEVGPYVYKEALSHENVTFLENGTLSAIPYHPLVWVPELSEGHSEDDELVLPNIALLSITHVVREANFFTRFGLNVVIKQTKSEPLLRMTAKEFMFGYQSKLLSLGNKFMPSWISFDKLGLIDRMYDFEGDYETVYTGETNASKSGLLDTYRGSTELPQWKGKHCSNIQDASDGTKFPSFIKPNARLKFFRKSLCRPSMLIRQNETVSQSLSAYRYTFAPNAMDNGYFDPENKCFCRNDKCLPYGLLDVTECYYGFPIALSYPHFLYSDPSLLNAINGTTPDPAKHESYFLVQPESGLPLDLAVRFQINMALGDVKHMTQVEKFANMVLPMLWMEIRMYSLPHFLQTKMQLYINVLPTVEQVLIYSLYIFGAIFIIVSLYLLYKMKNFWSKENRIGMEWSADELEKSKRRRTSKYIEKPINLSNKELEVYYSSLIPTVHQDFTLHEFLELREDSV